MKNFKTWVLYALTFSALTTSANAALGNEGGGGDAIVCGREGRVYLADYYLGKNIDSFVYDKITNFHYSGDQIRELESDVFEYLTDVYPEEAAKLAAVELAYYSSHKPLPELDDDNIKLDIFDHLFRCEKKQLAYQNIEEKYVWLDASLFKRMTSLQKVMLDIHERYINLLKKPGESTLAIRMKTISIFNEKPFGEFISRKISKGNKEKYLDLQISAEVLSRKQGYEHDSTVGYFRLIRMMNEIYANHGLETEIDWIAVDRYEQLQCSQWLKERKGSIQYDNNFLTWLSCVKKAMGKDFNQAEAL